MNASKITMTIGIPTYNRAEAVARRVQEIKDLALGPDFELLVIDNASTDGTYELLKGQFAGPGIRVLKNDSNLGYAGNVFRLIDEVQTDYLILLSDEDRINQSGLEALAEFCKAKSPAMVSPRAQVGTNETYRGRRSTRRIEPAEFESSAFYVSGLTYSAVTAKALSPVVRELAVSNSAANAYPQVLLAALAVAGAECYFLDALVSTQLEQLKTHIAEPSGGAYFSVSGRWSQFVGYEEFFAMDHSALLGESASRLEPMRDFKRRRLLKVLHGAAVSEIPALRPYLWRAHLQLAINGIRARAWRR